MGDSRLPQHARGAAAALASRLPEACSFWRTRSSNAAPVFTISAGPWAPSPTTCVSSWGSAPTDAPWKLL